MYVDCTQPACDNSMPSFSIVRLTSSRNCAASAAVGVGAEACVHETETMSAETSRNRSMTNISGPPAAERSEASRARAWGWGPTRQRKKAWSGLDCVPPRAAFPMPHPHEHGADEGQADQQADPEANHAPAAWEAEVVRDRQADGPVAD